jgi:hypothetical protein
VADVDDLRRRVDLTLFNGFPAQHPYITDPSRYVNRSTHLRTTSCRQVANHTATTTSLTAPHVGPSSDHTSSSPPDPACSSQARLTMAYTSTSRSSGKPLGRTVNAIIQFVEKVECPALIEPKMYSGPIPCSGGSFKLAPHQSNL